ATNSFDRTAHVEVQADLRTRTTDATHTPKKSTILKSRVGTTITRKIPTRIPRTVRESACDHSFLGIGVPALVGILCVGILAIPSLDGDRSGTGCSASSITSRKYSRARSLSACEGFFASLIRTSYAQ